MEKRISYDEFMAVKRVAQAVNPLTVKRDKVADKITQLQQEYNSYDTQISALEAGIKQIIGFRVDQLVKKVIETTDKTDKNGTPVKVTKYLPTDMVSYDNINKQYVITIPDAPEATVNAENEETEVA